MPEEGQDNPASQWCQRTGGEKSNARLVGQLGEVGHNTQRKLAES
jgi:hypothetical protein